MNADQYNEISSLISEFSKADNDRVAMEVKIKNRQLKAADELLPEFAELKMKCAGIEAKLHTLAERFHVELFPDEKRSHKTPFGSLQFHKSTSLEFDDLEKTVLLIERECHREMDRAAKLNEEPKFLKSQLIRTHEEPNLEALKDFDDAFLTRIAMHRVVDDNFKVTPFKLSADKTGKKEKDAA